MLSALLAAGVHLEVEVRRRGDGVARVAHEGDDLATRDPRPLDGDRRVRRQVRVVEGVAGVVRQPEAVAPQGVDAHPGQAAVGDRDDRRPAVGEDVVAMVPPGVGARGAVVVREVGVTDHGEHVGLIARDAHGGRGAAREAEGRGKRREGRGRRRGSRRRGRGRGRSRPRARRGGHGWSGGDGLRALGGRELEVADHERLTDRLCGLGIADLDAQAVDVQTARSRGSLLDEHQVADTGHVDPTARRGGDGLSVHDDADDRGILHAGARRRRTGPGAGGEADFTDRDATVEQRDAARRDLASRGAGGAGRRCTDVHVDAADRPAAARPQAADMRRTLARATRRRARAALAAGRQKRRITHRLSRSGGSTLSGCGRYQYQGDAQSGGGQRANSLHEGIVAVEDGRHQ